MNFTISLLSLHSLFTSPFLSSSVLSNEGHRFLFNKLSCSRSSFSFLYSIADHHVSFKDSTFSNFLSQPPIFLQSNIRNSPNSIKSSMKILADDGTHSSEDIKNQFEALGRYNYSFTKCVFYNCEAETRGAAIHFNTNSSLVVNSCTFYKCASLKETGAIYAGQNYDNKDDCLIEASVTIRDCSFIICYQKNISDYLCSVVDLYLTRYNQATSELIFTNCQFSNCETQYTDSICEGQIRFHVHQYQVSYINQTNSNQKQDLSAVFFSKYVSYPCTIKFLNTVNAYGYVFYEFYRLAYYERGGTCAISDVNMYNTSFVDVQKTWPDKKFSMFSIKLKYNDSFTITRFRASGINIFKHTAEKSPLTPKLICSQRDDEQLEIIFSDSIIDSDKLIRASGKFTFCTYKENLKEDFSFLTSTFDEGHYSLKLNNEKESDKTYIYIIIGVVALLVIVAIILIVVFVRKRKQEESESQDQKDNENPESPKADDPENVKLDDVDENNKKEKTRRKSHPHIEAQANTNENNVLEDTIDGFFGNQAKPTKNNEVANAGSNANVTTENESESVDIDAMFQ